MKVSIIMSTYNRPEFLSKAIQSYLTQDYKDSELIILNNGSASETKNVLDKYVDNNKIKIITRTENNRKDWLNLLWNECDSDLICQLHDDDLFYDEKSISIRVEEFKRNEFIEVVYAGVFTQDEHGAHEILIPGEPVNVAKGLKKEYINFTTMMWKNNIRKKFMFDEEFTYNMDTIFKVRCLMECHVTSIPEPVMLYTIHAGQETRVGRLNGEIIIELELAKNKIKQLYGI